MRGTALTAVTHAPGAAETMHTMPDGRCLIRLEGEVDLAVVPDLVAQLEFAMEQLSPSLVLDMTAVEFIDSSGLAALVRARREAEGRGGGLVLTGTNEVLAELLELTRLDEYFEIVPMADLPSTDA